MLIRSRVLLFIAKFVLLLVLPASSQCCFLHHYLLVLLLVVAGKRGEELVLEPMETGCLKEENYSTANSKGTDVLLCYTMKHCNLMIIIG